MIGSTRSNSRNRRLLLYMLVLMLALAVPVAVLAQTGPPGGPPVTDPGSPPGGPNPATSPTPMPTVPTGPPTGPDPTPTSTTGPGPIPTATSTTDMGGNMGGSMGPPAHELANRVVKHVATPVQFVVAGEGFHFFFIGADGSTVSGPTIPGFAELAEMHPSGEWVSLLNAVNPLTGKQVHVDYIPKDMTIRTFTYYPDKGMDVNKPYIFNFGADLAVNVEAW